jgi:hypothetical protein
MHVIGKYVGLAVLTGGLLVGGLGVMSSDRAQAEPPQPVAAGAKLERHPHIRRALRELREARHELKEADHDFGGHRKDALEAVDRAIRQLQVALKYDRR